MLCKALIFRNWRDEEMGVGRIGEKWMTGGCASG